MNQAEQLFCPVAVSNPGLFREDWQRVKEGDVASVLQMEVRSEFVRPFGQNPARELPTFDDFPVPGDEDAVTGWVRRRAANQARDEFGERFPDRGRLLLDAGKDFHGV